MDLKAYVQIEEYEKLLKQNKKKNKKNEPIYTGYDESIKEEIENPIDDKTISGFGGQSFEELTETEDVGDITAKSIYDFFRHIVSTYNYTTTEE